MWRYIECGATIVLETEQVRQVGQADARECKERAWLSVAGESGGGNWTRPAHTPPSCPGEEGGGRAEWGAGGRGRDRSDIDCAGAGRAGAG